MIIRDALPTDYSVLESIHQQNGFAYDLPQFRDFECGELAVDDDGRPRIAIVARKFAELTCLVDRTWENPAWRFEILRKLHSAMEVKLVFRGYQEAACWLAPQIEKAFERRLKMIDSRWQRADWTCLRLER